MSEWQKAAFFSTPAGMFGSLHNQPVWSKTLIYYTITTTWKRSTQMQPSRHAKFLFCAQSCIKYNYFPKSTPATLSQHLLSVFIGGSSCFIMFHFCSETSLSNTVGGGGATIRVSIYQRFQMKEWSRFTYCGRGSTGGAVSLHFPLRRMKIWCWK